MIKFILVRHGNSIFNKDRKYQGQMDVALNEIGFQQAECTAKYLLANYQIDAIYASDLCRTMDTARPVAEALNLPIHPEKGLREIDVGLWSGMYIDDARAQYAHVYEALQTDPSNTRYGVTGENRKEFLGRCKKALQRIALENDGKTVMITTHGGVVRTLFRHWASPEQVSNAPTFPNASVSVVEYDPQTQKANYLLCAYTDHLKDMGDSYITH